MTKKKKYIIITFFAIMIIINTVELFSKYYSLSTNKIIYICFIVSGSIFAILFLLKVRERKE
jgi:hypothetical protein